MRTRLAVAILTVAVAASLTSGVWAAEAWVMLGGDSSHSGYADQPLRTPLSLLWRHRIQDSSDAALSSPVAGPDKVYFCLGKTAYALDRNTGEQLWKFDVMSDVTGTPVLDLKRQRLYVPCEDKTVYAVDTETGRRAWEFRTGAAIQASPTMDGDLLYVASDDRTVYAIDLETQQELWRYQTTGEIKSAPVVYKGSVYVAALDRFVYAITVGGDGIPKFSWRQPLGAPEVFMALAVERGNIIAAAGNRLLAFDAANGARRWEATSFSGLISGAPAVSERMIYVGSKDGSLYAVQATTGQVAWRYPSQGAGEPILSAPVVRKDTVFVRTEGGTILAVNARTGQLRWQYHIQEPEVLPGGTRVAAYPGGRAALGGYGRGYYGRGGATEYPLPYGPPTGVSGAVPGGVFGPQPGDLGGAGGAPDASRGYYQQQRGGQPYGGYSSGYGGGYPSGYGGYGYPPGSSQGAAGEEGYQGGRRGAAGYGRGVYGQRGARGGRYGAYGQGEGGEGYGYPPGGGGQYGGAPGQYGGAPGQYGGPAGQYGMGVPAPAQFKENVRSSVAVTDSGLYVLGNDGALYALAPTAADSTPPVFSDAVLQIVGEQRVTFAYPLALVPGSELPGAHAEDVSIPGAPPINISVAVGDEGSGLDPDSLKATLDGRPAELTFDAGESLIWYTYNPQGVARPLDDGQHDLVLQAADYRGHVAKASVSFMVDRTLPAPKLYTPTGYGGEGQEGYPPQGGSGYPPGGYGGSGYPPGGYGGSGYPPGGYGGSGYPPAGYGPGGTRGGD